MEPWRQLIAKRLVHSRMALEVLESSSEVLARLVGCVTDCLSAGGTLFTCGNGGSAAEAMHMAEELVGRYRSNRPPLRANCLNADPTALTCIANDFGFEEVFARPLRALGRRGDALLVFSTSGRSPNLLRAAGSGPRTGSDLPGPPRRRRRPRPRTVPHGARSPRLRRRPPSRRRTRSPCTSSAKRLEEAVLPAGVEEDHQ